MEEETKYKALSLLASGKDNNYVASATELSISQVIRLNKELKEAQQHGKTDLDMERILVPTPKEQLTTEVNTITEAINPTSRLNAELQSAACMAVFATKRFIGLAESAAELTLSVNILCELQKAFFNSNSTTVNVQNNLGTPYQGFLDDKPKGVEPRG